MPKLRRLLFAAAVLLAIAHAAGAQDRCFDGPPHLIDDAKREWGQRHHPIGRPLPDTPAFNRPGRCADGIWFFDRNGNGRADAEEVRLFGPRREVDCGSCHGESLEAKSPQAAGVFLRLETARLCLECHNL